jgi:hypothetical protein
LVISVGEGFSDTRINPNSNYDKIAVTYHEWPGFKYAVGFGDESIVKAMKDFRDKLQTQLNA